MTQPHYWRIGIQAVLRTSLLAAMLGGIHARATAEEYAPLVALWILGKKPVFLERDEQARFFAILRNMQQVRASGKPAQTDKEICFWTVRQVEHSLKQNSFLVYDDGGVYGWRSDKETQRKLATLIRELADRNK
jgi:hypothetical protein